VLRVLKTRLAGRAAAGTKIPSLYCDGSRCYAACGDGQTLELLQAEFAGVALTAAALERELNSIAYNPL